MKLRIIFLIYSMLICITFAKSINTDSLWNIWNNKKEDKIKRLNALQDLGNYYSYNDIDKALEISDVELDFAVKNKLKDWEATAHSLKGTIYYIKGYFPIALRHMNKARQILNELGNYKMEAFLLANIASVHSSANDPKKNLEYLEMAFDILDTMKSEKYARSQVLNNIGLYYQDLKDYEKAITLFRDNLPYYIEIDDYFGKAHSYNNIGNSYFHLAKYDSAMVNFEKSMVEFTKGDDLSGTTNVLRNMGSTFLNQGKYNLAYDNCKKAYDLSIEYLQLTEQGEACECLYKTLKALKRYDESLYYHEKLREVEDSVINEERIQEITRLNEQFKFKKETAADSIAHVKEKEVSDAKLAQQESEIELKKNQQYALFGGLALVLVFAIFMYNRFKVTRRQKDIIAKQKERVENQNQIIHHQKGEVEEKNKEILDSITYARRLQEAILPPQKVVKEYLQNSFILYKPKDIVAGDFYFMEAIDKKVIIAAADCTGHGVPGAMVSVVCANAMNRAVKEFKLIRPDAILNKVRELVVETFERSESEVKDGMDISLCVLDLQDNKLHWSGANNPAWIIRSQEIIEFKADKQPIGKYDAEKPFTAHDIELLEGDVIYIFTDGYEDQFGGEKGKKFKSSKMKELFLSISHLEMEAQKSQINTAFENWKGDLEQVDDVCVIGIRI